MKPREKEGPPVSPGAPPPTDPFWKPVESDDDVLQNELVGDELDEDGDGDED